MRDKTGLASLILCGCAAFFGTREEALSTVIDDFDTPQTTLSVDVNGDPPTFPDSDVTQVTGASTSILGTDRKSTIAATAGAPLVLSQLVVDGSGVGYADIINGANANSTTLLGWDGNDAVNGFSNTDLTVDGANAFMIDVLSLDYGPPGQTATFQLDVFDTGAGTKHGRRTVSVTSDSDPFSTVAYFYFSDFLDQGSSGWTEASFASVNRIVLTITGTTAFDLRIDNFETNPEPSTFALLGVVCVGLCIYQCRRRRHATGSKRNHDEDGDCDPDDATIASHE